MNKSLRYIAILAILPLFTAGLGTSYFTDVDALKGQGVRTSQYGSATDVCGLQLCSEYPGGKAAWEAEKQKGTPVAAVEKEEPKMEKKSMMEKDHMEEETDADLGSVLRLSRANVPAEIPMHKGSACVASLESVMI